MLVIPETVLRRVYLVVKGGLGNQMFQAALGVAIEAATGAAVRYIVDDFFGDPYGRKFLLDAFPSLSGKSLHRRDIQDTPFALAESENANLEGIIEHIQEHEAVILDGYWQNERFFSDFSTHVRQSFLLNDKAPPSGNTTAKGGYDAIGLHVRRSDYGHHGLVRTKYYKECINYIRSAKGNIPLNIFSDELNFCRYTFSDTDNCEFFSGDRENPLVDFQKLSENTHFILANSSFSWWAAWLGEREGSIICAPQPWCVFEERLNPLPERWIKVLNAVQEQ